MFPGGDPVNGGGRGTRKISGDKALDSESVTPPRRAENPRLTRRRKVLDPVFRPFADFTASREISFSVPAQPA